MIRSTQLFSFLFLLLPLSLQAASLGGNCKLISHSPAEQVLTEKSFLLDLGVNESTELLHSASELKFELVAPGSISLPVVQLQIKSGSTIIGLAQREILGKGMLILATRDGETTYSIFCSLVPKN